MCIVLIMSCASPGSQVQYMLMRDLTVLSATHAFIQKWNEPYLPLLPSPRVLISCPAEVGG